jgi:hypothetical protein
VTYADGRVEIEEVKGYAQEVWRIKKKIFGYRYPEITLKVIEKVQ